MTTSVESILARCVEFGECVEWTQGVNSAGHPTMSYQGGGKLVRRVLAQMSDMHIDGRKIRMRCNNARCVNPAHFVLVTHQQLMIAAGRAGKLTSVSKSVRCAMARRATAKLTPEVVAEIRGSSETLKVLAKRYGVGTTCVANARNGRTWGSQVAATSVFSWRPSV